MALKSVEIIEGCIACGLCVEICPEVFVMDDLATVIPGVNYSDYEAQVIEAADSCPVEVIKYEKA
jgi:ferredoxin